MREDDWYPILGFESPSEYRRFVQYLEACIDDGSAVEVAMEPVYSNGKVHGGRWFRETATAKIWRLVEPDPPFRGLWEPVITAGADL